MAGASACPNSSLPHLEPRFQPASSQGAAGLGLRFQIPWGLVSDPGPGEQGPLPGVPPDRPFLALPAAGPVHPTFQSTHPSPRGCRTMGMLGLLGLPPATPPLGRSKSNMMEKCRALSRPFPGPPVTVGPVWAVQRGYPGWKRHCPHPEGMSPG